VLGNPATTRLHAAKGEFPVPLHQANQVVRAFLHIKGVRDADTTHSFSKRTKGFGLCPSACEGCAGHETLTIGKTHFVIEKVSGGGASTSAESGHWLAGTEQLAGLINVVTWVHLRKQGKDVLMHCSLLIVMAVATGLLAGILAVFAPKCEKTDTCQVLSEYQVMAEYHSSVSDDQAAEFGVLGGGCDPGCAIHNCSVLAGQCAAKPPPCFSFADSHCDEPVICPIGSDFGDCGNASSLVLSGRYCANTMTHTYLCLVLSWTHPLATYLILLTPLTYSCA